MKTFTFFYDPSHGWLRVTKAHLEALGFTAADFSGYSYRNEAGTVFYLEEDCDAPKFLSRYENASGTPAILEKQSNSVRRLPRLHQ